MGCEQRMVGPMSTLGRMQQNGVFWWTHRPHSDACEKRERDRKLTLSDPNTDREPTCTDDCGYGTPWPALRMLHDEKEKRVIKRALE